MHKIMPKDQWKPTTEMFLVMRLFLVIYYFVQQCTAKCSHLVKMLTL